MYSGQGKKGPIILRGERRVVNAAPVGAGAITRESGTMVSEQGS